MSSDAAMHVDFALYMLLACNMQGYYMYQLNSYNLHVARYFMIISNMLLDTTRFFGLEGHINLLDTNMRFGQI